MKKAMKKTKIICTIGPTSENEEVLRELMLAGLNVVRLNLSHGNHEEHKKRIDTIKKLREELELPIGIMLDTRGPEIRLGKFNAHEVHLEEGQYFTLTTRDILGDETIVNVGYEGLPKDVKKGDIILIDDGLIELKVVEIKDESDILCLVQNGGLVEDHKGVNVPGVKVSLPAVTQKDYDDILFGIENGIDFIAASFIRKPENVLEIRKILEENGGEHIHIISKIENQEAVDNIDEILKVSDSLMVARGDLGVEITTEEIPIIQKQLIRKCNEVGKPVITATQMLDSMIRNPRPTRAEVTDVANAIFDGTDAIMLSGETAAGKYPLESVKTMYNIAMKAESAIDYKQVLKSKSEENGVSSTNAISKATCTTAQDLEVSAILTATSSGYTASAVSKFRPKAPIIAATTSEAVMRRLSIVWGVYPVLSAESKSTDEVIDLSIHSALEKDFIEQGDLIVITAGIPVGVSGTTNLIKVHTISEVLLKGVGIGNKAITGKVVIADSAEELERKFKGGDVIVCNSTDRDMIKYIENASAIITEQGGLTSHAAIVGLNLGIPTVVGVEDGTVELKDGDIVTVDSITGSIYKGKARVL